jgi:hypothetical protein
MWFLLNTGRIFVYHRRNTGCGTAHTELHPKPPVLIDAIFSVCSEQFLLLVQRGRQELFKHEDSHFINLQFGVNAGKIVKAASGSHTVVLTESGRVHYLNQKSNKFVPIPKIETTVFKDIAAGWSHNLFLPAYEPDVVYCIGNNEKNQCGPYKAPMSFNDYAHKIRKIRVPNVAMISATNTTSFFQTRKLAILL